MELVRYENINLKRIELLLEKLLQHFEKNTEEQPVVAEIEKALKDIENNKKENNIGGWNFI